MAWSVDLQPEGLISCMQQGKTVADSGIWPTFQIYSLYSSKGGMSCVSPLATIYLHSMVKVMRCCYSRRLKTTLDLSADK